MNRNRKRSEKTNQKRVRSGINVTDEFKVVIYPDYKKRVPNFSVLTDSPTKGYRPELNRRMADWVIRKEAKKAARRKTS